MERLPLFPAADAVAIASSYFQRPLRGACRNPEGSEPDRILWLYAAPVNAGGWTDNDAWRFPARSNYGLVYHRIRERHRKVSGRPGKNVFRGSAARAWRAETDADRCAAPRHCECASCLASVA
jgi:hypothetical protein